jgi:hypothetical protein
MRRSLRFICLCTIFFLALLESRVIAIPVADEPLETSLTTKEVKIFGIIYPRRFNAAQGEEAHYHLLVWKGGASANALIETPADDLEFHDALVSLGAHPGDNLTMASWNKRQDPNHPAPREKVGGSLLEVRITWQGNPTGVSMEQALQQRKAEGVRREAEDELRALSHESPVPSPQSLAPSPEWRFGGNRDRVFNKIPFAPRPGCLACLYSCPSGKVSNSALSVHDYVETPSRFVANTDILPPDGTPVIVTFHLVQ